LARVCYVIIAHNEPANLLGLIGSLWNPADAFLVWIDGKADQRFVKFAKAAARFGDNVQTRTASVMAWGGFSIVDATLTAYSQLAVQVGQFSHVVLCSGTHVPLLHPDAIFEQIRSLAGWMDISEIRLPQGGLSELDRTSSQGWWRDKRQRIRYRYVEVPGLGMLVTGRREAWVGPTLPSGSQWHVLRSDLVGFVLEHESGVRDVFHDVNVADEHAFQWIVAQSPALANVRRGDCVFMEWAGASPRRLTFDRVTKKVPGGKFLFARKAVFGCAIEAWHEYTTAVIRNRLGADRLAQVASRLIWDDAKPKKGNTPTEVPPAARVLLEGFFKAVSSSMGSGVELSILSPRRYVIATERHLDGRGPVCLICAFEPGLGVAVIPALRRPSAPEDPLRLQPGMPGLWDWVNLPIDGRTSWTLTRASANARFHAIIKAIIEGTSQEALGGAMPISEAAPTSASISVSSLQMEPAPHYPRQALLVYTDTNNLGDEIQSLAVQQFLPAVDSLVDRDSLATFTPKDHTQRRIVISGWFSGAPENWPPSEYLDPLLISMHISCCAAYRSGLRAVDVLLSEPLAEYLRHYGPVGARDLHTVRLLNRARVDCYFSGCATLTLPRSTDPRDQQLLVLNDLPPPVVSSIRARTSKHIMETSHAGFPERDPERRLDRARELLALYRNAGCVVTIRLHCALASMAMGTPTLLLDVATDQERFEGLNELLHHCSVSEFLSGHAPFDPEHPVPTLDRHFDLADALRNRIRSFALSAEGGYLPYPLSDHQKLEAAQHVQQLLIGRIAQDRRDMEKVTAAHGKLLEALQAMSGLEQATPLDEKWKQHLATIMHATAELTTILGPWVKGK